MRIRSVVLLDIVIEGDETVEVLLLNGIEFVIMAARATDRQA